VSAVRQGDRRLIRDFNEGRSAARNDRPRSVCSLRPSEVERWEAWQAGYDYEAGEQYSIAEAIPPAIGRSGE
jgi:hypothetical protein